jgi:hypothetical protein
MMAHIHPQGDTMAARTPTSLQSGEDYAWKNPAKHLVYQIVDATTAMYWTSAARDDTTANAPFALKATVGDGVMVSTSSGLASTMTVSVSGASVTAKLHIFDGIALDPNGGTGAAYIESYASPAARLYQNKHWLTYDFPTDINTGDTWTSALRAEVYDWAWQDTSGVANPMGVVAYAPTTGVFTFTVPTGNPTGRLHVWTY